MRLKPKWLGLLGILGLAFPALALDQLYFPNLSRIATGSSTVSKAALDVALLPGSGTQAEDAAHASGDAGSLALGVRNDAGTALAADGDYIPFTMDSGGRLRVDASITEVATAADGGSLPALLKIVGGYDGANTQALKTDVSGSLQVDVESSALPTGAATEAKQDTIITHVDTIETLIGTTNTTLTTIDGRVDGLETLIGTTNTTLTTIDGRVDGLEGYLDQVEGYLDGLETLIGTTNTTLTTIDGRVDGVEASLTALEGYVDGLETLIGTTNTTLTTIDGRVDGLETLIGTTNSSLTTIDGRVDQLEGYVDGIEGKLDTIITQTNQTPQNAEATDSTAATATGAAESEAAPADAVGFILSADDANTANIRWRIGGTASATAGHELQPGRDTGYIPAGVNLSIYAVSGSQTYQLTWVRR